MVPSDPSPCVRRNTDFVTVAGVDITLYFATLRHLRRRARTGQRWRFFLIYSTMLTILLTIDIAMNAVWGENMWITHRDDEGGVPVFLATQLRVWYQAWGSACAVSLVFMSDGLLVGDAFGNDYDGGLTVPSALDIPPVHYLWFQSPCDRHSMPRIHSGDRYVRNSYSLSTVQSSHDTSLQFSQRLSSSCLSSLAGSSSIAHRPPSASHTIL